MLRECRKVLFKREEREKMKTIGLIGGMSWESSAEYYRILNELTKKALGNMHSCKCILYSVEFGEIEALQRNGEWEKLTNIMVDAAQKLEKAGAEFVVICTNTMHMMAPEVQAAIGIPVLHIADAAAEEIKKQGLKKVGLLGTRFTMEKEFYKGRIAEKHGIEVIVPSETDQTTIHNVIYNELVQGVVKQESKNQYKEVIQRLVDNGAEGIILGCTEIPMLIKQDDISVPIFDTTTIHAEYAMEYALGEKK